MVGTGGRWAWCCLALDVGCAVGGVTGYGVCVLCVEGRGRRTGQLLLRVSSFASILGERAIAPRPRSAIFLDWKRIGVTYALFDLHDQRAPIRVPSRVPRLTGLEWSAYTGAVRRSD